MTVANIGTRPPRKPQRELSGYTTEGEEIGRYWNASCGRFRVGTSDTLLTARQLAGSFPGNTVTGDA